ncbi:MAG: Uma2 family endonuclease [Limnothrix sp. RL_2_0]|nr:Uma2 family endonuclease [Limnothrix sp. RL_2_0]
MRTLAKWTVGEYHELIEKGLLDHKKVELLNGELIEMAPESPMHRKTMRYGETYLRNLCGDAAIIFAGHPITLTDSEPEPDLAIICPPEETYDERHPNATDVLLLIEVSRTTLSYDIGKKKETYAKENIQEYWVLDVSNKQIYLFNNLENGDYQSQTIQQTGDISPTALPSIQISVEKLLGNYK